MWKEATSEIRTPPVTVKANLPLWFNLQCVKMWKTTWLCSLIDLATLYHINNTSLIRKLGPVPNCHRGSNPEWTSVVGMQVINHALFGASLTWECLPLPLHGTGRKLHWCIYRAFKINFMKCELAYFNCRFLCMYVQHIFHKNIHWTVLHNKKALAI